MSDTKPSKDQLVARAAELTAEEVFRHLIDLYNAELQANPNAHILSPDDFFSGEEDLATYRTALAWWPDIEDMPQCYSAPDVRKLCFRYFDSNFSAATTFTARLEEEGRLAAMWLAQNGYSVSHPNEDTTSRRKRKNRTRMRDTRAPQADPAPDGATDLTNAKRDALRDARERCKQVKAEHNARVAEAHTVFMRICDERKAAVAEAEAAVRAARAEYNAARSELARSAAPDAGPLAQSALNVSCDK